MQLDLFLDVAPPPSTAAVVAFPLDRHVGARSLAAHLATLPRGEARRSFYAMELTRLIRQRQASGLSRAEAVADVAGFDAAVRRALAFKMTAYATPVSAPPATVFDLGQRLAVGCGR